MNLNSFPSGACLLNPPNQVANAGVAYNRPILDMTAGQLDKVLRINVLSVHLCYKFAAKQMIRQGTGGKLIAASSVTGYRSNELLSAYAASKVCLLP